jgi:hypothetical protein
MEQDREYMEISKARVDAGRKEEAERFPLFTPPKPRQAELFSKPS